jgi:hypothetical protein
MNTIHFRQFEQCRELPQGSAGRKVASWAETIAAGLSSRYNLDDEAIDRSRLKAICADPRSSDERRFLACMAWGGMRSNHGRSAWSSKEYWLHELQELGRVQSRECAYSIFSNLRRRKRLPGVGPAYFTKLIFFMRPDLYGYIMDQWTAKSVQLIAGSQWPELSAQGHVLDSNTPDRYENFCSDVDRIAERCQLNGEATEAKMFSSGGRNPGGWRKYVRMNWRHC